MADIYGMLMDGMQSARAGADAKKKRGLAALVGQAYSAPQADRQGLLGQIATGDPALAATTQKTMGDWDDAKQAALTRSAQMILAAPEESRPQIWARIVASGEIPGLSPQYDPVKVPEMAQKIVAMGAGEAEQFTLSPGSKRFDASGRMLAEVPFAPANASLVSVPDGQGGTVQMEYDPRTRQFAVPQYPGQSQQPAQAAPQGADVQGNAMRDAGDFPGSVESIVSPFGGRITSTTGGQHNPGSKHYSGGAVDVGMGRESPEQQAQILAALQANPNLRVRDERTRPPGQKEWGGPHLHVERGQQVAQAGRMGYTPPKANGGKAAPSGYAWGAGGTLRPIPGGPAEASIAARNDAVAARKAAEDAKAMQKAQVAQQRQTEAASAATQLVSAIDSLTQHAGFGDLGTAVGDFKINAPLIRSDAKDAQESLKNVAGQVALTTMARLKALSSSGATGFGSLTAPELKLLENSIATLQSDKISNKQLTASLKIIRDSMEKVTNWSAPQQADTPRSNRVNSSPSQQFGGFRILED